MTFEGPELWLPGRKATARYDDDTLAALANVRIEKANLTRQAITRVPPLPHAHTIGLHHAPKLATLAGIELATGLTDLRLSDLPALDLDEELPRLAELPDLATLRLDLAGRSTLPAALAGLPSLISLALENVDDLDWKAASKLLAKLPALRSLELEGSYELATLAFGAVSKLVCDGVTAVTIVASKRGCLRELVLKGSYSKLPDAIGELAGLERLELRGAHLLALPSTIGKLGTLRELVMHQPKLAVLPATLVDCARLEVLDLDAGEWVFRKKDRYVLRELPAAIGELSALRVLKLRNTSVKRLPESIGSLAALRELSMPDKCEVPSTIGQLSLEKFHGPDELAPRLLTRGAPIPEDDDVRIYDAERLPSSFGDPLTLDLHLRDFTGPLPQLANLPRVQRIELFYDGDLATVFRDLAKAPHLVGLTLHGKRATLPDELGRLTNLTHLEIASNDPMYPDQPGVLTALPQPITKLVNLKVLTLHACELTTLPALPTLEQLTINAPRLTKLPTLPALKSLHASDAEAFEIDPAALPGLERLRLWRSKLTANDVVALGKLSTLRELSLCCKLVKLDALLRALASTPLEVLELDDYGTKQLPASIGLLAKLTHLTLDIDIAEVPSLATCTALREVRFNYGLKKTMKAMLPPGRWRAGERSNRYWYERTD